MNKKLFCILASAAILLTSLPVFAQAKQPVSSEAHSRSEIVVESWDFESNPADEGWTFVDADGDGITWEHDGNNWEWDSGSWWGNYNNYAHSGSGSLRSYSCRTENNNQIYYDPDNWAITPAVTVPDGETVIRFYGRNHATTGVDIFRLYAGTTTDIDNMTPVCASTAFCSHEDPFAPLEFTEMSINVSAYAGQTVYFAFRHFHSYDIGYMLYIDDVEIVNGVEPVAPGPANLVYGCYFNDDEDVEDWQMVDANGDGFGWDQIFDANVAYECAGYMGSESFVTSTGSGGGMVTPDNWLISPPVKLPGEDLSVTFYAGGYDNVYNYYVREHFTVYAGTSPDINEMTEILSEQEAAVLNGDYELYTADLSDFAGQTVYIAIRHHNCYGEGILRIDQFEVWGSGDLDFNEIDTIELNGLIEPEYGAYPALSVTVPNGAGYTLAEQQWRSVGSGAMSELDIFNDDSDAYFMRFTVTADFGNVFAEQLTVIINGGEVLGSIVTSDASSAQIETESFSFVSPEAPMLWGDADGDGDCDLQDTLLLMRCLIDIDTVDELYVYPWCDVNADGAVDLKDTLLIMRRAMGAIPRFPVEMN